jgi:CRISPR-associated endonuclease/helicase Cas3
MTSTLDSSQFAQFFGAVNAPDDAPANRPTPFPWQEELVTQTCATGRWPDLLDLPTGAGKTAAIDIAVFTMAVRSDVPRRIVFVVDRRVIVHQAAQRARRLAERLRKSDDEVVRMVAERLRALAPFDNQDGSPLRWAELRGGIARDESWALRPDVPAVLISTVDQVGSRLLLRGYGISRAMRPVHAGLIANDALFLLDEVHLSQPFAETLRSIAERYRPPAEAGLPDRWQAVELSATPSGGPAGRDVRVLSDRDRDPIASPVLARRLAARKLATTRLIRGRGGDDVAQQQAALARGAADVARSLLLAGVHRVVGVVLNRVDTARLAYQRLQQDPAFDCVLMTGRMRPFDRDDLLVGLVDRIRTGRTRSPADRPLVVVATQAIEAGADFDFDALVTECASFDALKQRFGRVDRDGELSARGTPSESVIVAVPEAVRKGSADPVYGTAVAMTWAWLPAGRFDFAELRPDSVDLPSLLAPKPCAPVLLSNHLDRWIQTYPYPSGDPDVGLWLHGMAERQLDVNLVWRADLTDMLLSADDPTLAVALVSACPPGSGEAMPVPLRAVQSWLADLALDRVGGLPDAVADVEGVDPNAEQRPRRSRKASIKPVLRWNGDRSEVATAVDQLLPGDTLVMPAAYGGITSHNWDSGGHAPCMDLGHRVAAEQRGRAVLRLHPCVLDPGTDRLPALPMPTELDADDPLNDTAAIVDWLAGARELHGDDDILGRMIVALRRERKPVVIRVPADPTGGMVFVLMARRPMTRPGLLQEAWGDSIDSEPETSSFTGRATSLFFHLRDVECWARQLAAAIGFPKHLADDLALAGRLHDLGKADPRFQAMLGRGSPAADGPLAKSAVPASRRADRERVRRDAGYPRGGRHELLSVALVQSAPDVASAAHDLDLVLHLVASHHGYCRPFAPMVHDSEPVSVTVDLDGQQLTHASTTVLARVDSGVADRFWVLVRRYGWFGLVWLECVLRLADHRASATEQDHVSPTQKEVFA